MELHDAKPMLLRMTPRERQALEALAESEGRRTPAMVRELIRAAAQQRGLWPELSAQEVESATPR